MFYGVTCHEFRVPSQDYKTVSVLNVSYTRPATFFSYSFLTRDLFFLRFKLAEVNSQRKKSQKHYPAADEKNCFQTAGIRSPANDRSKRRIVGSPDDPENRNPSRLDAENPDPALRSRPLRGLVIMTGFRYEGDGEWTGGRIYDPNSGNTYKGTIRVVDSITLKLRGYVGISLLGRTDTWTRRPEI